MYNKRYPNCTTYSKLHTTVNSSIILGRIREFPHGGVVNCGFSCSWFKFCKFTDSRHDFGQITGILKEFPQELATQDPELRGLTACMPQALTSSCFNMSELANSEYYYYHSTAPVKCRSIMMLTAATSRLEKVTHRHSLAPSSSFSLAIENVC